MAIHMLGAIIFFILTMAIVFGVPFHYYLKLDHEQQKGH